MPSWPIDEITKLLEPSLAHMGYSIYAVQQAGQGGRTLRITIDKPQGFISIDDCERVSQVAGPLLDKADLIDQSYTLEVSSPGAERTLRDRGEYERFVGHRVNLRYRAGESEVALEGMLESVDDDAIGISGRKGEITRIPWEELVTGRLVASL